MNRYAFSYHARGIGLTILIGFFMVTTTGLTSLSAYFESQLTASVKKIGAELPMNDENKTKELIERIHKIAIVNWNERVIMLDFNDKGCVNRYQRFSQKMRESWDLTIKGINKFVSNASIEIVSGLGMKQQIFMYPEKVDQMLQKINQPDENMKELISSCQMKEAYGINLPVGDCCVVVFKDRSKFSEDKFLNLTLNSQDYKKFLYFKNQTLLKNFLADIQIQVDNHENPKDVGIIINATRKDQVMALLEEIQLRYLDSNSHMADDVEKILNEVLAGKDKELFIKIILKILKKE